MLNCRVDDLWSNCATPESNLGGPESHENGKFAWIMGPEGNKVALSEPMACGEKKKGA